MELSESYKILSPLNHDSQRKFGSLFLVENKVTGEKGVLKSVSKIQHSAVVVERLQHEASFNFEIHGLPKVLAIVDSDTEFMMVRSYIEGSTLEQRFKQTPKRRRHQFLCMVLEQLGQLLEIIHSKGLYHCDIKPGNILIDANDRVHLIDFGLALRQGQEANRKLLFPLGFAAPELLLNQLDIVDHRTDYYALGITLWRLYVGRLPLTHPNPSIFTNLQLTHPLPEGDGLSRTMYKVLLKMCHKHAFKSAPNTMNKEHVRKLLTQAVSARYETFEDFFQDFIEAGNKGWFTKQYRVDTQD